MNLSLSTLYSSVHLTVETGEYGSGYNTAEKMNQPGTDRHTMASVSRLKTIIDGVECEFIQSFPLTGKQMGEYPGQAKITRRK